MKKISVLLALLALFFCDLALAAASAVATAVTPPVQAQSGSAPPRVLRQGDEVHQGDTIITGQGGSIVLKFDDGSVAALTQNSRMAITSYDYNPATESGNSLLSLVTGGMRVITGLIGKRTPDRVAYRAATATIGIRGSDGNGATSGGHVIWSSNSGVFTFSQNNQTFTLNPGEAIHTLPNGTFNRGTTAQVLRSAASTPAGQAVTNTFNGLNSPTLNNGVNNANPGTPRQGGDTGQPGQPGQPSNPPPNTPGTTGGPQGGGGGGGQPSQ